MATSLVVLHILKNIDPKNKKRIFYEKNKKPQNTLNKRRC